MLVVLLQISSPCKLLVRLIVMIVLRLIYVTIVYAVFRVLDGRIRPIERELRALGA